MAEPPPVPAKKSPAAMDLADLAWLMSASGARHAAVDRIRADIEAGAPTNADGTVNLVHYGAWLVRQVLAMDARGAGGIARGD